MKKTLQSLLILFGLCLCGLVAFQWARQAGLRTTVEGLTDTVEEKNQAIQTLQATVKRDEGEIQRLDSLKDQLDATVKSNAVQITTLIKNLDQTTHELTSARTTTEDYKKALEQANRNIALQNESIKKQNQDLQALMEERNKAVSNYNKKARDYNDLATQWNNQQEELARANNATAAPKPPSAPPK